MGADMENAMMRLNARLIFGGGLVLLGGLLLLEKLNVLHGAGSLFWGVIFLLGAASFIAFFAQNPGSKWWAIIPAMLFLGMGGSALLPRAFSGLGGGIFLGALGLAFWIIYFSDRARWWGIIPGGVLFTLAGVSVLNETQGLSNLNSGSLFFIGLGLTFLLVALLPNPFGQMRWAYIPAIVLVVMGALLGSRSTAGLADYIWPAALILSGLLVLYGFYFKKE
jgi:hypothetical protein